MNNGNQSWKCPNCDTINSGRRCLVCGSEKAEEVSASEVELKNTMPKTDTKSNKGIIITLSVIVGVLAIAVIVICILAFGGDGSEPSDSGNNPSHETVDAEKEKEEEQEEPEKDEYINDSVFGIKFNLSVDKIGMDKQPNYSEFKNENITYKAPDNFKKSEGDRYFAYDETAYIKFTAETDTGGMTVEERLEEEMRERPFDGNTESDFGDGWYSLSATKDNVVYYKKCLMGDGCAVDFVFVYPKKYSDIYDDYIENIEAGLTLPDRSGVEIIEE